MDAKVGDWVITPRQGRTVELNALWYNALRAFAGWCEQLDHPRRAEDIAKLAALVKDSFNRAFWNVQLNCCFDVLMEHGADASIRPNQLFAVSLPFPVLAAERHAAVLDIVRDRLLTPFGVRTLAPEDPAYQGRYGGDVVSRDRAYHQGSAFPWLLGPYLQTLTRVRGRNPESRSDAEACLRGTLQYLTGNGLGRLCELFDGSDPHMPGGAIASARSVGEVLRAYVEDVLGREPGPGAAPVAKPATVQPHART
jgi:glycogen debranching enzyme